MALAKHARWRAWPVPTCWRSVLVSMRSTKVTQRSRKPSRLETSAKTASMNRLPESLQPGRRFRNRCSSTKSGLILSLTRSPISQRDSNRIHGGPTNLRYFLFLSFALVLTLTIACRRTNTEFVTVALPEKFTTLDTLTSTASDSAADRVRNLIFNTLVRKNESFDYVGELAKDITVSPDGMVVTFKLRDDVKFHNGKAFTSADVKYTFDELFKSNSFKSKAFFD